MSTLNAAPFGLEYRPSEGWASPPMKEVERLLQELLASWRPAVTVLERRKDHRVRLSRVLELTPVEALSETPIAQAITVLGRDLSLGGVSFLHSAPLPYRKVAISFEPGVVDADLVIVRLTWCRFTHRGHYESGGRFIRRWNAGAAATSQ